MQKGPSHDPLRTTLAGLGADARHVSTGSSRTRPRRPRQQQPHLGLLSRRFLPVLWGYTHDELRADDPHAVNPDQDWDLRATGR